MAATLSTAKINFVNDDEKYLTYLEELRKFYTLKRKYTQVKDAIKNKLLNSDNTIEVKKKLFAKQKFKCVNCGKEGGTLFLETNESLKVSCGNIAEPCDIGMEIKRFNTVNLHNEFNKTNDLLLENKKKIMTTKLDFLFNYIEEDKAVELFDEFKEELNKYQEKFNKLLMLYDSIVNNEEFKSLVNTKQIDQHNLVNEYKEYIDLFKQTSEKKYLVDAVELYAAKIKELDVSLMETKYKYNFIEKNEDNENSLVQKLYSISDFEIVSN